VISGVAEGAGVGVDEVAVAVMGLKVRPVGTADEIGRRERPAGSTDVSGVMAEVPISFASLPRSVVIIPLWQF